MWSATPSNVEPPRNALLSRRSGVVADTPLRPLVHLFEISGPVRSFFSFFCLFSGLSCACRRRVRGVCLVGRCPWGEAVGADVPASRLVTLGPGRRGGLFGLGSFDPDGFFDVVSDG